MRQTVLLRWVTMLSRIKKYREINMGSTLKRIIAVMMAASLVCILVPGTTIRAEVYIPEWAQDPSSYEEVPLQVQEDLPAKLDLRDRGVVTCVKIQDP